MLAGYLKQHGFDDIHPNPEDAVPQRPFLQYGGFWQLSWQKYAILTDDERGDHFSQGQALADEHDERVARAEETGDFALMQMATMHYNDAMRRLVVSSDKLPVEVEAIAKDDETQYRLNVLSE